MENPVKVRAMQVDADNIQKCMEDPVYAAKVHSGKWCAACDMSRPCLCDEDKAVIEMRAYYEANRRTAFRAEPTRTGSWGRKIDVLMTELYRLATKPRA